MPNWVTSRIVATGPAPALVALRESGLNFQRLRPCPYITAKGRLIEPDDEDNKWYYWCSAYWGTKWTPSEVTVVYDDWDNELRARLDTAWDPPHTLFAYLTAKYPGLVIVNEYEEEACERFGYARYSGGSVTNTEINPHENSLASLRSFAQDHPWFDYEAYVSMLRQLGADLEKEEHSPDRRTDLFVTEWTYSHSVLATKINEALNN
jgi:hypothetical protein